MDLLLLFLLLLPQVLSQSHLSISSSPLKLLPGFQGHLPFELETGYMGVGEADEVQLFYYFVRSESDPDEDPLLLWLTGGPGCSAFSGLVYEIGPISFKVEEYNGSLPTLILNPYSWTKVSNIIFVDSPVGTGFSYARNNVAYQTGDMLQIQQLLQFLRKWLVNHPEFLHNQLYVGGDSFSGMIVPALVLEIAYGNEDGVEPPINLQGYLLGNTATVPILEVNMRIPYSHGMGLISDELYTSLKKTCGGEYEIINPANRECLKNMQSYQSCISGINRAHILEHKCVLVSPKPPEASNTRRYLKQQLLLDPTLPTIDCRSYAYLLAYYWANDKSVQEALHIREGNIKQWIRCNDDLPYTHEILESFEHHVKLSKRGYRALVYSGDHDMLVPFIATQKWIRSLNYSIVDDWRPWRLDGQVAGFTRSYTNHITFATVKGGGHTAPEYKPAECLAMYKRWISKIPL